MRTPPHRAAQFPRAAERFSTMVDRVVDQYCEFALQPVPMDPKGFAEHHNACKSALMHFDWLLKEIRNAAVAPQDAEPMVAKIHVARDALVALDARMNETLAGARASPPGVIGREQPHGP